MIFCNASFYCCPENAGSENLKDLGEIMSRIGKKPITIPAGVEIKIAGRNVSVKSSKGELSWEHPAGIEVKQEENQILVSRKEETKELRAFHGLTRALINNMVIGLTEGFEKKMLIYGVGYNCDVKGNKFVLNIGFCHPVEFDIPANTEVVIDVKAARGNDEPAKLAIKGIDKQVVGEFAAKIRAVRPPEPYKGKGIRYIDEYVIRKEGKPMVSGG